MAQSSYVRPRTFYIERLLQTYAPSGVPPSFKSTNTPAEASLPQLVAEALISDTEPPASELRNFQAIIGSLLYCATHTRPDVAYAVALLCRAMSRPTPDLYQATLRVLYYLYTHRHIGLRYEPNAAPMSGYSDLDCTVKHSKSGFVFQ